MSTSRLWRVVRSYGTDSDGDVKFFIEKNGTLSPLDHHLNEMESLTAIQAFRDPTFPLIWTQPSEIVFQVWYGVEKKILNTDQSYLLVNDKRISRHDILAIQCVIINDGAQIISGIELNDGSIHEIFVERNNRAALDPSYTENDLAIDAAWAKFLTRDLAAWAGVPAKEFRDDALISEYWPGRSIVKSDHYLSKECVQVGEIRPDTFRVMSDVDGKIEHYDSPDFKTAKAYADDVASEDHLNISLVFDARFNALYFGKHY